MKEYYVDITSFSGELARWLVDQGATTIRVTGWEEATWDGKHIFIGRRRVHKFAGSKSARLFFDENTVQIATALLLMHPDIISSHNIKVDEFEV